MSLESQKPSNSNPSEFFRQPQRIRIEMGGRLSALSTELSKPLFPIKPAADIIRNLLVGQKCQASWWIDKVEIG